MSDIAEHFTSYQRKEIIRQVIDMWGEPEIEIDERLPRLFRGRQYVYITLRLGDKRLRQGVVELPPEEVPNA